MRRHFASSAAGEDLKRRKQQRRNTLQLSSKQLFVPGWPRVASRGCAGLPMPSSGAGGGGRQKRPRWQQRSWTRGKERSSQLLELPWPKLPALWAQRGTCRQLCSSGPWGWCWLQPLAVPRGHGGRWRCWAASGGCRRAPRDTWAVASPPSELSHRALSSSTAGGLPCTLPTSAPTLRRFPSQDSTRSC